MGQQSDPTSPLCSHTRHPACNAPWELLALVLQVVLQALLDLLQLGVHILEGLQHALHSVRGHTLCELTSRKLCGRFLAGIRWGGYS